MLHVQNLSVQRGQNYRIELPELHLARGQVRALVGASGCGKSTVLEMLGLILTPETVGCFVLDGEDVGQTVAAGDQTHLAHLRARQLGFVLQSGALLPFLTVRQNIELPLRLLGLPRASALVTETVATLKLEPLLDKLPAQLSMGERQRVAFVRAIAHQPRVLLADEPTAALDPPQAERLFALIIELVQRFQIAALIVSHDWALIERSRIAAHRGQVDKTGTVFRDA